ncbi:MAG TPA: hypothetical protein PK402_12410 [Tepidisphaeraceae bacterium]|nr:hypothetical protein [Tepidisphaeraceae bacterium]
MFPIRLMALVWFVGGIYVLVSSQLTLGLFGAVSAVLGIPAGRGILMNKRWAIVPAIMLCVAWAAFAVLFFVRGSGFTFNNVSLLVAAVACGVLVCFWHRARRLPQVTLTQA